MTYRDDFEHRLGQGLKRWARAGEPTMDLEAHVRERIGRQSRRRIWWLGGIAAAAAFALAAGITFPAWAGAASSLPVVGPVITRMILEDAGLKWAYDMGLIGGTVAEVTQNGVTVRILGVVADARRTTVLYQVQGVQSAQQKGGSPFPIQPPRPPVDVHITEVDGKGAVSFFSPPDETPLGYIGTVSTLPLEGERGELTLLFRVDGEEITLTVPASRAEMDRFSREVAVNQTLEYEGVRITVESVIYTPAETVVRYREEGQWFRAPVQWDWETEYDYLEVDGRRYRPAGGSGFGVDHVLDIVFPPVEGPARLVLKPRVKGSPVEAVWPLEEGAVVEVSGVPVTLVEVRRTGSEIHLRWKSPAVHGFRGIADFEVLDSEGNAYPLQGSWHSISNYVGDGVRHQYYATELPEGVEPVAVRARQAGVLVNGPWVFDLPGW